MNYATWEKVREKFDLWTNGCMGDVTDTLFGLELDLKPSIITNHIRVTSDTKCDPFEAWYRPIPTKMGKPYIKITPSYNTPNYYIINKGATILFWEDGSKTIVKRNKEDDYNKRLGFLTAYFQKTSGMSKTKANKYLDSLMDEDELNGKAEDNNEHCLDALAYAIERFKDKLK